MFSDAGPPAGSLSTSSSTSAVSSVSKLPGSMLCAMPIVLTPDSSMVPPTMIRLTFGWPHGSAWSLLFRIFSRNRLFRPLSIRSCLRFSVTLGDDRVDHLVLLGRAVMPHLARNAENGLSVTLPGAAEDRRC